jgi:hypothetical protein
MPETTRELEELSREVRATASPERLQANAETIAGLVASGLRESALKEGDVAPEFVRIPLKANAFPEGSRAGFRDDSEHRSERSDAGFSIVPEVFGFVKIPAIRSVAKDRCR